MSGAPGPAVLLVGGWPGAREARAELEAAFGEDAVSALASRLLGAAREWAGSLAAETVQLEDQGWDEPARLTGAVTRLFAAHDGPVLVAWPVLLGLRAEHARAALGDLGSGCDLVFGPTLDGGCYLVGIRRPFSAIAELVGSMWRDADVVSAAAAAARADELELGILRAERALRRPADVHAALADPLLRGQLEAILRRD